MTSHHALIGAHEERVGIDEHGHDACTAEVLERETCSVTGFREFDLVHAILVEYQSGRCLELEIIGVTKRHLHR